MSNKRILIIKLGAFGDFFLAQSAFEAIRRRHADDHLTLLTIPQLSALARMSARFDEVWEAPQSRTPATYMHIRRMLRGGRFDQVYDLQGSGRTNRYFYLLFPGPWPQWSGTARGCSHNDAYPGRRRVPVLKRYARQLAPFGIKPEPYPDLSWLDADISRFGLSGDYALLIPGCSAGRPYKRWPGYPELAKALAARGIRPVVLGTAIEKPLAAAITAACPQALDLTDQTSIAAIAALARRALVSVGNDTGPTHLIAAVGGPTVALFCDVSKDIDTIGRQALVHRRPDFASMDVNGVLEAIGTVSPDNAC